MLFINSAHKRCRGRKNLVDEDEDGLLWCKLDTLSDDVDELADCQILCGEVEKIAHQLSIDTHDKQGDAH